MRSRWLILPFVLLCTAQLRADSVTLVTGEKITGTIKSETPSEITIDVPISASITDERVLRKEDVAKVDKAQPDELAYQQLIQVQPNAELSYASQTYDQILAALNGFETQYPNSTYLPEIKKLADTFQDEKKRVDAGEVKYLGQWLSKDEAVRRSIQIQALEVYNAMQQQAAAGNLLGAMQTFDSLEKDYATTRSYPAAVVLARQVVLRLQKDLVVRMQGVLADQDQLKKTIAFTAEPEKSALIASARADEERMDDTVDTAVKSGVKWVPLIPRCQLSIDTLQKTANNELVRLASIQVEPMNDSLDKVDAARNAISSGDFKTASTLLTDAGTLWPQNEAAHYWADRLKERMATPSPTPVLAAAPIALATPRLSPHPVNIAAASSPIGAPDQAGDNKPFYMTIPGAISIAAAILVIGGIAASLSQKKARQQAAE